MAELNYRQWYYRGSLKSCNYSCSYCPFSKRREGKHEAERDEKSLVRFVDRLLCIKENGNALMVAPYGEALRHGYYWRELGRLSESKAFDRVGAQTNLSFSAEEMLGIYMQNRGRKEKLYLWCTFHPEMTTVEEFTEKCSILSAHGIHYCVGAVGISWEIEELCRLRKMLPEDVYMWLNKMDGMGRAYTDKEVKELVGIDPYFKQELIYHRADVKNCRHNIFVEADGTMRRCNLSRGSVGNLYEMGDEASWLKQVDENISKQIDCGKRECGCYLAYCNLEGEIKGDFGVYPAYRVPERV